MLGAAVRRKALVLEVCVPLDREWGTTTAGEGRSNEGMRCLWRRGIRARVKALRGALFSAVLVACASDPGATDGEPFMASGGQSSSGGVALPISTGGASLAGGAPAGGRSSGGASGGARPAGGTSSSGGGGGGDSGGSVSGMGGATGGSAAVGGAVISSGGAPLPSGGAVGSGGSDCPFSGKIRYTLTKVDSPSADQQKAYDKIEAAMDRALEFYNCYADIDKAITAQYVPSVDTADGNPNGNIRFGKESYMNFVTAMHEISHVVGVGADNGYDQLIQDGVFTGPIATAKLRELTGDAQAEIHGDAQHFWPYGLNYESEWHTDEDGIFHCYIVSAIREDMGWK